MNRRATHAAEQAVWERLGCSTTRCRTAASAGNQNRRQRWRLGDTTARMRRVASRDRFGPMAPLCCSCTQFSAPPPVYRHACTRPRFASLQRRSVRMCRCLYRRLVSLVLGAWTSRTGLFGRGSVDLIWVPGWISHIEVMWDLAEFAWFLERLATFSRVVTFDKRGTGLSDRIAGVATLSERVEDVTAVMDAAGIERAVLVGWFDAAAILALFASRFPDRVYGSSLERERETLA